ncbi:formate dehydrogenase accessory sulfurtransferase FdhD [Roseibium sp. RKSG952]|nr:formate dehydrogenase accessory sulfurtransferase FdhD [Roseibium sp. RKSG952]
MTVPFRDSPKMQYEASVRMSSFSVGTGVEISRELAQETPVALVFNGTTTAVMMASPSDIQDFAYGFALTEGFISDPDEIVDFEQVAHEAGIEARYWLKDDASEKLGRRRRASMGPVGCGLCGIDSLEQAVRNIAPVSGIRLQIDAADIASATDQLRDHQELHDRTRSAHAAGFLVPGKGIVVAREDIGRHNAVDKLLGALIRNDTDPGQGAVVVTSRVSVELIQKTAALGCSMLIAVSAPTAFAVKLAQQSGMTLVANARRADCEVFTHAHRIRK